MKKEFPIVTWYRIALLEKKMTGKLGTFWVEIIFNTIFTSEKCIQNCPITGTKLKKAASDSVEDVCDFFDLDYYNEEDYAKAEGLAIKLVDSVYEFLRENGFEAGRKVKTEKMDEVLRLIDFSKMPQLVL
jgi:hypothetical protein